MLWSHNVSAIRLHTLSDLVFISLLLGVLCALSGASEKLCTTKMTLQNFRPILSWELKNHSVVPTHYTLWYTIMSQEEDMMAVENCTNIPRPSCDLTGIWKDRSETYVFTMDILHGNRTLGHCQDSLTGTMPLEPPNFTIVGFTDHINVLVTIPPVVPSIIKEILADAKLIFEKRSEGIVTKHRLAINRNTTGNITYVISSLIPNTNYCVSLYFDQNDVRSEHFIRSPLKCVHLPGKETSESSESKRIGIISAFSISTFVICIILILKRTGHICLRYEFPKVLHFHNFSPLTFLEPPLLEINDQVLVITVERKKKVWNYNYGDESDSDTEAAPRASAGGYTMHGLTGLPLRLSTSSVPLEKDREGEDAEDSEDADLSEPEATTESLLASGPSPWPSGCAGGTLEGPENPLQGPFVQEASSSPEGSGGRIVFNVDLSSVCMRALDDSVVPQMLTLPEGIVDLEEPEEESNLLGADGEGPEPSEEDCWSEDASSETSDSSGSNVDFGNGYLAR